MRRLIGHIGLLCVAAAMLVGWLCIPLALLFLVRSCDSTPPAPWHNEPRWEHRLDG